VVGRDHDLACVQPQLNGDILDGVNRGAIHVGLAGLAQAAVAGGDAEAVEQTFQGCGTAVRVGGLDDLARQPPPPGLHGCPADGSITAETICPAARNTS
jgi:hypothetical protein